MIEIENQHWVPKFLLKSFADDDGKIFRLDIAKDRVTKLPPKRAASRPNFNILLANGHPRSFESEFQRLETAAARPLRKIVQSQLLQHINQTQRMAIARFVAAQSFRTEAYRLGFKDNQTDFDLGTALDTMLTDINQLAGLLDIRGWALLIARADNPFYLGDNPVVLQRTEKPEAAGELGMDMAGVEVFLPLSPLSALYMICPKHSQEIVGGFWNSLRIVVARLAGIELADFDVSSAIPVARKALMSAGPLYQAIKNGVALEATDENIENLNYLQCAWASSGIYSNQQNFTFARRVFLENPEYRKVLPVRLHRNSLHTLPQLKLR